MTCLDPQEELPHPFRLTVRRDGSRVRVTVSGDLDDASAGELDRALVTQVRLGGIVVLDLREIAFIDASALGILLRADVNARFAGTGFSVMVGECARRMFGHSRVASQFTYADPSST
jgi:anti-anti-sigma factor